MPIKKVKKATIKKQQAGLTVEVYNIRGKVLGEVDLPKDIFGVKINSVLMAQAVRVYLANQRQGTASTKTRGEVRGSTRKIYRQKHTGRARHGAIRAPIFVGGGIVFGPKPRSYKIDLPKKMKRKALFSALALKLKDKAIKVITGLEKVEPRTKEFLGFFKKISEEKKSVKMKFLLVIADKMENVSRAVKNMEFVDVARIELLNTYQILNHQEIVFAKETLSVLEKKYGLE